MNKTGNGTDYQACSFFSSLSLVVLMIRTDGNINSADIFEHHKNLKKSKRGPTTHSLWRRETERNFSCEYRIRITSGMSGFDLSNGTDVLNTTAILVIEVSGY